VFLFGTNLKMHQTPAQTAAFVWALRERLLQLPYRDELILWVAPPYTSIQAAAEAAHGAPIWVGAQNMHWADEGAFTGEISPHMLKACGAQFVMLGHVERRTLFGETDELVHQKVLAAARHNLKVMLCVGEPRMVKEAGAGDEYVAQQLKLALRGFDRCEALMILYEPVWSVGMGGVPADPADVSRAMDNIRGVLQQLYGPSGKAVPLLYGGSVDEANCAHYARLPQAAGIRVGRAGLSLERFWDVLTKALAARMCSVGSVHARDCSPARDASTAKNLGSL